jgi:1-deoxy-D-xylulose-5-phosphate reductoisomerase
MNNPKRLAVIGSTGSIGRQTLDIVRALPDNFKVIGLAAGHNHVLLAEQIEEFKPEIVYHLGRKADLGCRGCRLASLEEIASHPEVDLVVIATAGKAGLRPTLAAIRANKQVALSNKEPLVMAGEIIQKELKNSRAAILPVDSEHSAVWQCLNGETLKPARIILTASGGPFLHCVPAQLAEVTVEQALKHPSWQMGPKITIDSATLMNKGLEVIEAHWLFDLPFDRIDILIHPQSIVHSMVELADGTLKAQLSYPDMRFPIQYALSYPERLQNLTLPRLDWRHVGSLVFEQPDYDRFPCLKLALEAGRKGGTYPTVLCAADEVAVDLFLRKSVRLNDIARLVEGVLGQHRNIEHPDLNDILAADVWARERALGMVGGVCQCQS